MQRPGRIIDIATKRMADACFNHDYTEYCTHFASHATQRGRPVCKIGGKIEPLKATALATSTSLPLCDSDVKGCSSQKHVCSGTTEGCQPDTEWTSYPGCDCGTAVGYMECRDVVEGPAAPMRRREEAG
jgi:hypothetical protein